MWCTRLYLNKSDTLRNLNIGCRYCSHYMYMGVYYFTYDLSLLSPTYTGL